MGLSINNKTKTYDKQIYYGNPLLEVATRSKDEIPASMRLDDAERKGITQLEHHMKAATKSPTPSLTDGAVGRHKEPANNREQIQATKQDKKKGGKPDIIKSEDEDSDDECCNKDEALANNKKGGKKKVKLLSDIYNTS